MNFNQAKSQIAGILNIVGFCLAVVALAKFAGVQVPVIKGGITECAMVAAACLLAR